MNRMHSHGVLLQEVTGGEWWFVGVSHLPFRKQNQNVSWKNGYWTPFHYVIWWGLFMLDHVSIAFPAFIRARFFTLSRTVPATPCVHKYSPNLLDILWKCMCGWKKNTQKVKEEEKLLTRQNWIRRESIDPYGGSLQLSPYTKGKDMVTPTQENTSLHSKPW